MAPKLARRGFKMSHVSSKMVLSPRRRAYFDETHFLTQDGQTWAPDDSKLAPKRLLQSPARPQDGLEIVLRCLKVAPKCLQADSTLRDGLWLALNVAHDGFKLASRWLKLAPRVPKRAQDGSGTASETFENGALAQARC